MIGRRWFAGIWPQVFAAIVLIVAIGFAVFLLRIRPQLVGQSALATELAYDQLVAGALAVTLAAIFGRYAVEQVKLAREATENDRRARDEQRQGEIRRVLLALQHELNHNRTVALSHEGRLSLDPLLAKKATLTLQRRVFDELHVGPLWSISLSEDLWSAVSQAYWDVQILEVALRPEIPWWASIVGTVVVYTLRSEPVSIKGYVEAALGGFAMYVLYFVKANLAANRKGTVGRTRRSVEAAMDGIYQALNGGMHLPWDEWDGEAPPEMHVLPVK